MLDLYRRGSAGEVLRLDRRDAVVVPLDRHGEAMEQLRVIMSRDPRYPGIYVALAASARALGNEPLAVRFDAAEKRRQARLDKDEGRQSGDGEKR